MKYVRGTRTLGSQTMLVTCQGEMDVLAVEELGISPPASKPTLVPPAGPSGKPALAGPSSKPTPTPPESRPTPARERVAPRGPEKIFPRPRPKRDAQFWRFWGGLAALIAASLAWSIYLYLTRY